MTHPSERTFQALLANSVNRYGDRVALSTVDGISLTYSQFAEKIKRVSGLLHALGVGPGDRVAILSENKVNWGVAYFAIATSGAIAVPILPDFPEKDIANIIRHSECRILFVSEKLLQKTTGAAFPTVSASILLDTLALIDRPDLVPSSDLSSNAERVAFPHPVKEEDIVSIFYTSGTMGFSKGVILTHANIVSDAIATTAIVSIGSEDRMLSILPLAHTYENTLGLVTALMVGASVYYLDRPPTAPVLLPAMAKVRPTIMLSVPLIIEKIYKAKIQPRFSGSPLFRLLTKYRVTRKPLSRLAGKKLLDTFGGSLRVFAIGGAPIAADVELFLREAGFPYAMGYGLTETAPLIAGTSPEETRYRSTGKPLPGTEIRILDADPATGEGEIIVKGPTVMKGYFRDPERTAEVMTPDGWLRTGDLGTIDADGYVFIKGRLKNMILGPSGKNIYPEEIESAINESDLVLESLVFSHQEKLIARAHLNYEEIKKKFGLSNDHETTQRVHTFLEELRRQVNQRLASFSRLHRIVEQPEPFEKTPTLKIKRHLYGSHPEK
ncbi:MAG: Long-chain-fatty-acid--CoA ligase [Bacteroidetes bacterium]|nr:Long-chain-fatty-acid--CoA ligase [Bacteroidota bacterium]